MLSKAKREPLKDISTSDKEECKEKRRLWLSLIMKDFIQILIVAGLPLICALLEPPGKCCTRLEYVIS